jgi:hypothetical protein
MPEQEGPFKVKRAGIAAQEALVAAPDARRRGGLAEGAASPGEAVPEVATLQELAHDRPDDWPPATVARPISEGGERFRWEPARLA